MVGDLWNTIRHQSIIRPITGAQLFMTTAVICDYNDSIGAML